MANRAGLATKERMILVAERLFAQHGLESVPLRQVSIEAGQRNVAATNYHFTDRDGLIRAIFDYRLEKIELAQEQLLSTAVASTPSQDPLRVRGLVEAYVLPLIDQLDEGYFLGFIARMQLDLGRGDQYVAERWMRGTRLITTLLTAEFPEMSERAFAARMTTFTLTTVHVLATRQLHPELFDDDDRSDWSADFINILIGILGAPAIEATRGKRSTTKAAPLKQRTRSAKVRSA